MLPQAILLINGGIPSVWPLTHEKITGRWLEGKSALRERLQETPEPHSRNPIICPDLLRSYGFSY